MIAAVADSNLNLFCIEMLNQIRLTNARTENRSPVLNTGDLNSDLISTRKSHQPTPVSTALIIFRFHLRKILKDVPSSRKQFKFKCDCNSGNIND